MECKMLAFLAFTTFLTSGCCFSSGDPDLQTSAFRPTKDVKLLCNLAGFKSGDVARLFSVQLLVNTHSDPPYLLLVSAEQQEIRKGDLLQLPYPHSVYGGEVFQNGRVSFSNVWLKLPDMLSDDRLYVEYMCRAYYYEHIADTIQQNWNKTFQITAGKETQAWSNFNMTTTRGLSMNCTLQSPKENFLWLNITRQRDKITTTLAWMKGKHTAYCLDDILCWTSKWTAFPQLNVHLFDGDFLETDDFQCVFEGEDNQRMTVDFPAGDITTDACNQADRIFVLHPTIIISVIWPFWVCFSA